MPSAILRLIKTAWLIRLCRRTPHCQKRGRRKLDLHLRSLFCFASKLNHPPRVPPEISCTGIDQCLAHRADGTAMDEQGIKHVAWDSISRILDSDDSRAILLFYRNRDIRFLADGLLAFNTTLSSTC